MRMTLMQKLEAAGRARLNVVMYGPPGLGKTFSAMAVMENLFPNRVSHVVLPEDCPVSVLRGHYLPAGQMVQWHDGPCIYTRRHGGGMILDELNRVSAEGATFLHAVLDRSTLTLPNSETLPYQEEMWTIATMNESPDVLRASLLDRFPVRLHVDKPESAALEALGTVANFNLCLMAQNDMKGLGENFSLRKWFAMKQGLESGM